MTTWFTSDTHFGHRRILELGQGRPFETVEAHDSALASNWNSVVKPEDTVYHLGDVVLGPWEAGLGIIKGLNGYKYLVPGNHDRIFSKERPGRRENSLPAYASAFDEILEETFDVEFEGVKFRVSHFPSLEILFGDRKDRFLDLRPEDDGTPIIHGHTHQDRIVTETTKGTLQVSVGVDANNWTPVTLESILARI